jgi:hypothetical protein
LKNTTSYHPSPAHLIFIFFILQAVDYQMLFAQRYLTTFGRTTNFKTGSHIHHILTGDFNGDAKADLALVGDNEISIKYRDSAGWRTNSLTIERPILDAVVARLNRDKRDDLLVVLDNPLEIRSYLSASIGKLLPVWDHRLNIQFEKILVADINNDGFQDILFYGKKQLGILIYRGSGNGTFRRDTTIFPENSFSSLAIADINNDGLNDIIAANWISNDLMIYSGYGKLKFSDPQIVHGNSEAKYFNVARIDSDDVPDLVVGYPDERMIKTFHGDGFGGFQLLQTKTFSQEPLAFGVADVNLDGHTDVGILTVHGLLLELNNGKGQLEEEVEFAAGTTPTEFTFLRDRDSHRISAAVLDTTHSSVRYLYNAHVDLASEDDDLYGTGVSPGGILRIDFQHDGSSDLLVPNGQSRTISLFLSKGDGRYDGQIVFESATSIQFLHRVSTSDTMTTLVGYSTNAESIAVIGLCTVDYSHHVLTLPTQGSTDLLYVRQDSATAYLHIFALEQEQGNSAARLMEYEQINPTRFIERTYTSLTQNPLVAATISNTDNASYPDLIYAVYKKQQHELEIDLARGTPTEQYAFTRKLFTFGVDNLPSVMLWCSDINGDHIPDLVLNIREPLNSLYVLLGKKDSTYSAPAIQYAGEMNISARDDLQFIPQSRGRKEDILINNNLTRMLQLYHPRENGILIPAMRLLSTEGVGGYLVLKNPDEQTTQLILSDRTNGYLRVITLENLK